MGHSIMEGALWEDQKCPFKFLHNVVGSDQDHFVVENVLQAWKLLGCLQAVMITMNTQLAQCSILALLAGLDINDFVAPKALLVAVAGLAQPHFAMENALVEDGWN